MNSTYLILEQFTRKAKKRGNDGVAKIKFMTKIRTEIFIESNESLTVKRKRFSVRAFCEECRRTTIMVVPTEASFLARRDLGSIISLMSSNLLHTRYFQENGFFICLKSLCSLSFEDEHLSDDDGFFEISYDLKRENYSFVNEK